MRNQTWKTGSGFSLTELCMVLAGAMIMAATAVPAFNTMMGSYRLILSAQAITTQLQFARMKAVSSNSAFQVNFQVGQRLYRVEDGAGNPLAGGPYYLPPGVDFNNGDTGVAVTFGGNVVSFSPTGTVAAAGIGSAGRVKIVNRFGSRVDVVVTPSGAVRQTPVFHGGQPPF